MEKDQSTPKVMGQRTPGDMGLFHEATYPAKAITERREGRV